MDNYKTLTWIHIGGQMPQLRLFPQGGGEEEVVAIAAWSTDEINAFLASRLVEMQGESKDEL